ncbi:MAG: hypothetical protein OEW29_02485 [Acidimicrobiia bacterium]|nr:hypothetical protein [Acidimicrobiia bacterium]
MSFREMIDAMLSAHGAGIDPASVLEQHGMGDLPPDALSSALLHFAERAPLDVADALAPVVTRFSPVPFEPDDLPASPMDHAIDQVIDQGGDVFAVLAEVDLTTPPDLDDHLGDGDPGDFDHDGDLDHLHEVGDHLDHHDLADTALDAGFGDSFGEGHHPPADFDHGLDDHDFHYVSDHAAFDPDRPIDDALDVLADFDHDHAHLVPLDDTAELDTVDDIDDTPDEPLHEGLEDLAVSLSDMNVEIDRISHDPSIQHFDI